MKTHFLLFGWLILCLTISKPLHAQRKVTPQKAESVPASVAIRAGMALLYGDLQDPVSRPFVGATLAIPVSKIITAELPVDYGTLQAQQKDFYNSNATTRMLQVALAGSVDILKVFGRELRLAEIRPYAGLGMLFFNAEARDLTTGQLQRVTNNAQSHRSRDGMHAHGRGGIKRTHELAIPLGLRGATALSRQVSIFGDVRLNLIRTDKLDATLDGNNGTMAVGTSAFTEGNHYGKNSHDRWAYVSVGLCFYFGERFNKVR